MENVGHRIAALSRGLKRWTQQHLASEVGISQSVLSDIENDKSSPTWHLITQIAEVLEVPISALLPLDRNTTVFNNQSNEAVHNITNQYGGNFEEERRLWRELLSAKDALIAEKEKLIAQLQQQL